ncbi:MAG: PadR family transcriptional regulator [Nocardioides sp.]
MQPAAFPTEWLRGVLSLAVLHIVAARPTYGYAISVALAEHGLGSVKGGTLYPLLGRLEEAGHVTTEWRQGEGGPGRKYYLVTDSGRAALAEQSAHWGDFTDSVTSLLSAHQPGGHQ